MLIYVKLLSIALVTAFVCVVCYLLKRKTKFGKLKNIHEQIIIGIIFGILAIMGTEFGVPITTATANVRDGAVLCAGLIFGAPAGIIAGFMGGIERFFAAYWGKGYYTQIACSVSTIIAGFFAAFLRKFMLDDKRPSALFGFAAGLVMEVFHITLIFFTHFDDSQTVMQIVEIVTIPMVVANMFAVGMASFVISVLSLKLHHDRPREKTIAKQIQKWLLFAIFLCFLFTSTFVYAIQTNTATIDANDLIKININDVTADMTYAIEDGTNGDDEAVKTLLQSRTIGETGHFIAYNSSYEKICGELDVDIKEIINNYQEEDFFKTKIKDEEYCIMYKVKEGYTIVGTLPSAEAYALRDASIYINSFMEIIAFAILYILIYFLIKQMVITNMLKINKGLNKISKGDLNVSINVRYTKEFNQLSDDINTTIDTLKNFINAEKESIAKELSLATSIQLSSLPQHTEALDSIEEFNIDAGMFTAKEVGGDFYDYYMLKDNKLAFMIADVSGKGIPAAMFMMRAKAIIKALAEGGLEVNDVLSEANHKLCEQNEAEMFVTVWLGFLNVETGVLEYSSAGHNPPALYKNTCSYSFLKNKPGLVLAGLDGMKYKKEELQLEKGDRIFLYTDGVTEASNRYNELYGENRLISFLNENKEVPINELIKKLKEDIDRFAGGREQFDDITMIGVDYIGKASEMKELIVDAKDEQLSRVNEFVVAELEKNDVSMKVSNQISLSIEEVFINIAHYAYQTPGGKVIVKQSIEDGLCTLVFIDSGKAFDPLAKKDPDITLSADERKIGGLGIYMVKQLMDSVDYKYENNQNILTMKKKIK